MNQSDSNPRIILVTGFQAEVDVPVLLLHILGDVCLLLRYVQRVFYIIWTSVEIEPYEANVFLVMLEEAVFIWWTKCTAEKRKGSGKPQLALDFSEYPCVHCH